MGYIMIPKLGSGGSSVTPREMPNDWKYFTSLKEHQNDQAYLFYKGAADLFVFYQPGNTRIITLYGGSNGTTPLYRWQQKVWYRYENGNWVATGSETSVSNCRLIDAEPDTYKFPNGLHFSDLTGKSTSDPTGIGDTELFTVIIHTTTQPYQSSVALTSSSVDGSYSTDYGKYNYPLIAYSGGNRAVGRNDEVDTYGLEFVDITYTMDSYLYDAFLRRYRIEKLEIPDFINNSFTLTSDHSLIEFKIPANVTSLSNSMFSDCYSLEKVKLNSNITTIPLTAFDNCHSLKTVEGIENITTIKDGCFRACTSLEEIDLSSVTSLGIEAFYHCYSLKKAKLNNNVTLVTTSLFRDCKCLKYVNIPTSAQEIGDYAFQNNYCLRNVTLPNTLTTIGMYTFENCKCLTEITIPNSVTSIGQNGFSSCDNLKKITLGTGLTAISNYMFNRCYSIETIIIPNTITSIGSYAFYYCRSLRNIEIPTSVASISGNAFGNSDAMVFVKMIGQPPTLIASSAFHNPNSYMKILVPYDYINDYKTATNWSSTTNSLIYRQRGYKTFNQGDTLPTTDTTGNWNLTWYEKLDDVLNTTAQGTPSVTPITTAPYNGEFYCTISSVI